MLIYGQCSLPGSLILNDRTLWDMISDDHAFLSEGLLIPDLRSTCNSFTTYVDRNISQTNKVEIYERAAFLDERCPAVIQFDAEDLSGSLRRSLVEYAKRARSKARKATIRDKLEMYVETLERTEGLLTLDAAEACRTGTYLDRNLSAAAKMYYAILGARSVNGVVQIPKAIAQDAVLLESAIEVDEKQLLIEHAIDYVIDFFSLKIDHLHLVPAEAILALRDEGATHQALEKIKSIAWAEETGASHMRRREAREALREVEQKLDQALRRELKRVPRIGIGATVLDESISIVSENIPGAGLIRRGVAQLGRAIAKNTPLKRLDVTLTPIHTLMERLRSELIRSR